jgi:chromosome segregation protein
MKLKSVRIFGFKTFADKTQLDLQGEIAAIVGPNGCGKSNIVDAIQWGLGEANARQLRAQTSQEVIFSGSQGRKPVGMAEVTLLFDNEDGQLPIETPEVAITRRLTRNGESSYLINKRPCRLRDVSDLLADSGLGRAGYAIVSQSEIDQALAASPTQRRGWVDEAAGVMRYRVRRQESLRRLESAAGNLAQVANVMAELESQRGPLEREAEEARRCRAARASLREIEVSLLSHEAAEADAALAEAARRAAELEEALTQAEAAAAEAEKSLADDEALIARCAAQRERLRKAREDVALQAEQASGALKVAHSRLEGLAGLAETLTEEADGHEERQAQAKLDLEQAKTEVEAAAEALAEVERSSGSSEAEIKEMRTRLNDVDARLAAAKKAAAQRQRRELQRENQAERRVQVQEELAGLDESLPEIAAALKDSADQLAELEAKLEAAKAALAEVESERRSLIEKARGAEQGSRQAREQLASLEGRRSGLLATIEAYEGLAQGPRAVMGAVAEGLLEDVYTPVAEAISAPAELALAIETALGGAAGDLITPDDRAAKDAIEVLKRGRLGRATFQPLSLMRRSSVSEDLWRLEQEPGVVGIASNLVECRDEHRPVIESLLGRVLIVEDLDTALSLARTRGWSRLVTQGGEVVFSSGAVSGGQTRHQSVGLVQRKAELEAIEDRIDELKRQVSSASGLNGKMDDLMAALEARAEAGRQARAEAEEELGELKSWRKGLEHELTTGERSRIRLQREAAEMEDPDAELPEAPDIAAIEAERDTLIQEAAAHSADAQQTRLRLTERAEALRKAKGRLAEAERRLERGGESESARQERLQTLEQDRALQHRAIHDSEALLEKLTAELAHRQKEMELAGAAEAILLRRRQTATVGLGETRQKIVRLGEDRHQNELRRARAEGKRAASEQRLLEEYGLALEEAAAEAKPLEEGADRLAARLRKEIKDMGEVNLGAIDAFDRLASRLDELTQQTDDIQAGMDEIHAGIRELDAKTKDRFRDAFQNLQREFKAIFESIFEGGAAELELTDPDAILDSGVEIQVTLPGKRRQRLALLSGGERALSALAFLFSLLRIKPSPLVILDEVDAPLDGRNVERCIHLLRQFTDSTQFIMVTHNPTTIAAADVWFGVTMQGGVSTLIPMTAPPQERPSAVSLST